MKQKKEHKNVKKNIYIVTLPIQNGDFQSKMLVYQRVTNEFQALFSSSRPRKFTRRASTCSKPL